MKVLLKHTLMINILLLFLVNCSSNPNHVTPTNITEDQNDVNQSITLLAPDGWNTFKINAQVCLWVELMADLPVIISEQNTEVYELNDTAWSLITSNVTGSVTYVISPNENVMFRGAQICAHPEFGNRTIPVTLRFIVYGNFYQNETKGDQVSAFIDVVLHP